MYVVVQHTVSEPAVFWNTTDPNNLPSGLKLHHVFPAADGTRADYTYFHWLPPSQRLAQPTLSCRCID